MRKKRIVVVCPGRGSYTRETSNYLENVDSNLRAMIEEQDKIRSAKKFKSIFELDKNSFRSKTHRTGENASPLIYSCSLKDYYLINKEEYEVAAVCGNSMGWYIAMALSGALTTAGNYTTTLTTTGNTNVTLPTTGTIATVSGTESLTNKIINGITDQL